MKKFIRSLTKRANSLKQLPLHQKHLEWSSKPTMVPYSGYEMPVQYSSMLKEHMAVRKHAGLFDVSHMGEFLIEGPRSPQFVQKLLANNTKKLTPGQAQYNPMCNSHGGVIDDTILYKLDDQKFMLVVNAANITKDWNHILQTNHDDVTLTDISDSLCLLALQGPKSSEILQTIYPGLTQNLSYYHFTQIPSSTSPGSVSPSGRSLSPSSTPSPSLSSGSVSPVGRSLSSPPSIISRTGYTGELGFEIYLPSSEAPKLWDQLLEAGQPHQLIPAGLGARDTLRLEAGYCLYGHEITEDIMPHEAGIGWAVKLKAGDFIGRDALRSARAQPGGFPRKLIAFQMTQPKKIPREKFLIFPAIADTESSIGYVTSGGLSPMLEKGIGLALVESNSCKVGDKIYIQIRKKLEEATIMQTPIYKNI